jgi:flagellar biosynthesis/type III secretory pathway protein FliH
LRQSVQQIVNGAAGGVEVFTYPATAEPPAPSWESWGALEETAGLGEEVGGGNRDGARGDAEANGSAGSDARMAEEARRSFEAGRERGFQEGRAAELQAQAAHTGARDRAHVKQAARLAENFRIEQVQYFDAVEQEVVKLSLAVAARVLRREAQLDPLLLTGAVRVALGQLSASTQVRLKVPPEELELWTETMAHIPNLTVKPAVISGDGMRLGDCVMETELGSVDLGVRAQLGEIERGFFDRARRNPPGFQVEEAGNMAVSVEEEVLR